MLVDDQPGKEALAGKQRPKCVQQVLVGKMAAARIDDFPGAQEQCLIDDGWIGALGADPHLARVHHPTLFQLEGDLVEDIVADVLLVGEHLMDRCPRPRPVEIGAQSVGIQDIRDLPLGSAVLDEHAVHASDDILFVLGTGDENDPVGLKALLLAAR